MFDPITFPRTISDEPFIEEMTATTSSGIDVPNATTVKPIINWGIPKRVAIIDDPSTK